MKKSSAILATLSLLFASTTVNAFYAIGSCPITFPKVNNPFGSTGTVTNGQYYSMMGDDQYLTMVQEMLPAAMKPSASRLFADCNSKTITKRNGGTYIVQSQAFNGSTTMQIPYNFTCNGYSCYDPRMSNSDFSVVHYSSTDNLLILYNCIEVTEMIQGLV
jgi:hypothetical protein